MLINGMNTSTAFHVSEHAAKRYIERFAGNVTKRVATQRLKRILSTARRKRPAPGGATIYGTAGLEFVVQDNTVLTVYGADTRPGYALEA